MQRQSALQLVGLFVSDEQISAAEEWIQDLPRVPRERVKSMQKFVDSFEVATAVDYGWIADYAERALDEAVRSSDLADQRAEKLVTFLTAVIGLATALISTALVRTPSQTTTYLAICTLPSLSSFVLAVHLALCVQAPKPQGSRPVARRVLEAVSEQTDDAANRAKASHACSLLFSSELQWATVWLKKQQLGQAFGALSWGVRFLPLPLAMYILLALFRPQ